MTTDRIPSTVEPLPLHKLLANVGVRAAVATLLFIVSAPVQALMVGVTDGVVPNTSQNPAQTAGWNQGDPGWDHAVRFGYLDSNTGIINYQTNGVYLGDGWVLTAAHVGIPTTVKFQSGAVYTPVPHPSNQDVSYQVLNPSWNDANLVQAYSDLRLIRINGDPFNNDVAPAVPSLPIATQTLSSNDQVVIMGGGVIRAATQSHFNVNKATNPWTWTPTVNNQACSGSNCYNGYWTNGNDMRWGTNRIVSSDSIFGDGKFQTIIDGGTIAYVTSYDQFASTVTDPFEALGVGGDSGSSVFYKRNGVWQLTGIMNAKYYFSGQTPQLDPSNTLAIFGNVNGFADLATYNDPNGDGNTSDSKIEAVKSLHADYSVVGDLNLDGASGTAADLSAFVAGWRYNNSGRGGTITSWMHGDVTHDGKTDLSDFLRFRSGLSAGAGAQLTAMMDSYLSGGIPEPSTALLTLGPVIFFALRTRFRRPRLAD